MWLGSSALLCLDCFENILALYLTLQRWTSALPKSHRWAAAHLLCAPAGDTVYSEQGLGRARTHIPRMLPQLCGTWRQDQLISSAVSAQSTSLLLQWQWKSGSMQRVTSMIIHVFLFILILVRPNINLLCKPGWEKFSAAFLSTMQPSYTKWLSRGVVLQVWTGWYKLCLGKAQESPKKKSTHLEPLVWEPTISKSPSARSYSPHIPKSIINIDRGNGCIKQSWNESLFVLNTS